VSTTIKDIAKKSGLSIPTVSQVLNGTGRISAATRAKVLRVARELGYRPNSAARSMRSGRFGNVALLLPERGFYLPQHLLFGISNELATHGLTLSLATLPVQTLSTPDDLPRLLTELSTDGLLIDHIAPLGAAALELIRNVSTPAVWINNKMDADCVFPDDVDAGRRAATHLVEFGHERIAYVHPTGSNHYSVADRRRGYEQSMKSASLKPRVVALPRQDSQPADRRLEAARKILRRADRPTAVFCYGMHEALPMLTAALAQSLRVPDDLSIVACHERVVNDAGVAITTMRHAWAAVGAQAVQTLMRKIERPDESLPPAAIKFELVEGASCSAPPGNAR